MVSVEMSISCSMISARETDEADTDRTTLIRHLLEGQYSSPVRVVAFNTAEAGRAT
jgi:hypothetical protein